jgi:CubicO group peptidase (beta-lactamase class C family)
MRRLIRIDWATPLLVVLLGCGDSGSPNGPLEPPAQTRYFPALTTDVWETVSPAAVGWDTTALRVALDWAGTQRSTAVIVLWRGRIAAERYWQGWTLSKDSIIASAGKSVTAFLIGMLQEQGRLRLADPVNGLLGSGWSRSATSEARITIAHLLSMTSGLDDSLSYVVEPDTRFFYNNPAYYQTFQVMTRAAGQPFTLAGLTQLSRSLLWDRIGMRTANWRFNIDTGEPGFVLSCSARDMARFGLLVLNRGRWDGQVILADTAYQRAMLSSSSTSNPSYGYLWWLNGKAQHRIPGPYLLPTLSGPLVPSAPTDMVAALGKGDKKIYVVPSLELVVVRHGPEADVAGGNPLARSAFDEQLWARLKPAFRY